MIAALVPAAGRSERMGRPKLILPIGGVPLIARVVTALRLGGADPVVVVAPPPEVPGAAEITREASARGARLVVAPEPTPDMRASVVLGLDDLSSRSHEPLAFLLAPGDSPGISADLVARVIQLGRETPGTIVVPVHAGRRGHPVLIPWTLAAEVRRLPPGLGVKAALAGRAVVEVAADDSGCLVDLDTPADYLSWINWRANHPGPSDSRTGFFPDRETAD